MRTRLHPRLPALAAAAALVAAWAGGPAADTLPPRLDPAGFWRLSTAFSEASGSFHSDNLLSNELRFQTVLPALAATAPAGRAYLGVGPEQNFTYIAALRPRVAFIVDLRQGNRDVHLMYKALFALAPDRAAFVSRLFSRDLPAEAGATAADLFAAAAAAPATDAAFARNLAAVQAWLTKTLGLPLTAAELANIGAVYREFFLAGPGLRYQLAGARGGGRIGGGRGGATGGGLPAYADLMTATDEAGRAWSYLASDDAYRFVRDLQARHLVVPVVGNFAGPKALRAVAGWLRDHGAVVSAFYLSNVEQYLRQDGLLEAFCANAAALPLDEASTFIRSSRASGTFIPSLGPMQAELAACAR